ncbi:MAG: IclR family transcriptional regulator [Xanthobacteraceae bacterium]|uniref:IclR family transcriptional regulator n=1 Tax=Pseudolabrys sp. TaxID=1960880 RepID=UPI003D132121
MPKGARAQATAKSGDSKPPKVKPGKRGAKRAASAARDSVVQGSVVSSLAKGLRILEAFSADRSELTLSEIATLAQLDPGTAFRLLNTLVMLGYLDRVSGGRRFRLTLKVTDLGLHAIARADLREVARPILRSLVGVVNEAASLGVLDGADILYVERVRAGLTRVGVDIRIGTTIPAFWSTIGEAMLAYLPPDELAKVLSLTPRSGSFPHMPMNRDEITRRLRSVRENGYALRDSYFGSGLRVLAVPVLDIDDYPLAALSVVVPEFQMSLREFRVRALEAVQRSARDIARVMQSSGAVRVTA